MSRESRSKENRDNVLRVAAYVSPYGTFSVDDVAEAAADESVLDEALHGENATETEVIADEDALERLVEAGYLRREEGQYALTEAAREHRVGLLIEDVHNEEEVAADVEEMSMKAFRRRSPTGFMYLFSEPEMVYIIDAILDTTPSTPITPAYLADNAGVSITNAERALPKLVEVGLLRRTDSKEENEYALWSENEVTHLLNRLNATINRTSSTDAQAVLANEEKLPEREEKRFCETCGARGMYVASTLLGYVLTCPEGHEEWRTQVAEPAGSALRLKMMLETDAEDIEAIRSKDQADRTERERTILHIEDEFGVVGEDS